MQFAEKFIAASCCSPAVKLPESSKQANMKPKQEKGM
jgi:hypothetical protein